MHKAVADAVGVFLTILMVGVVVGTWTMCGTVPVVIYYGLMLFSPQWFLISIMVLCFVMAFVTGSSWTTAGTIGVAFMGVGISLGIPVGLTAGCIISGAMCGDKQSPLGAATNLTAAISKVDLYETLHSLVYVTIPSIVGCGIIYTVLGFRYAEASADTSQVTKIMNGLAEAFHLSPILLLPIIVLLVLIFLKIPTVPTLIAASLCGVALSVLYQGNSLFGKPDIDVCGLCFGYGDRASGYASYKGRADGNGIDDSADHPGTGFGRLPGADSDYDFCRIEDQRDSAETFLCDYGILCDEYSFRILFCGLSHGHRTDVKRYGAPL